MPPGAWVPGGSPVGGMTTGCASCWAPAGPPPFAAPKRQFSAAAPRPAAPAPALPPFQILEGHIRVKMFGVGRIVEGIVKDSLQNVRAAAGADGTRGGSVLLPRCAVSTACR